MDDYLPVIVFSNLIKEQKISKRSEVITVIMECRFDTVENTDFEKDLLFYNNYFGFILTIQNLGLWYFGCANTSSHEKIPCTSILNPCLPVELCAG